MDATRKAIFRSRLRQAAERKEKIDSPLARYNDLGELVCKVCNIPIKTEALWGAHLGSRKHKDAAEELKDRARQSKAAALVPQPTRSVKSLEAASNSEDGESRPEEAREEQASIKTEKNSGEAEGPTQAKEENTGPLPQGFFDNVAADMKARGIEAPKINLQEELEQFHKLIEEDVKAVDDRYREEEAEAAEIREEEEEIEQSLCLERVQMFKKRKIELRKDSTQDGSEAKESGNLLDELSSDDESEEDTVLDWRTRR